MEITEDLALLSKKLLDNPNINGSELIKILLQMKGILERGADRIHTEVQGR
jgi:hypothetical protein